MKSMIRLVANVALLQRGQVKDLDPAAMETASLYRKMCS